MSASERFSRAFDKQRAKSDASLRRTPSSIPKKEEPKKAVAEGFLDTVKKIGKKLIKPVDVKPKGMTQKEWEDSMTHSAGVHSHSEKNKKEESK